MTPKTGISYDVLTGLAPYASSYLCIGVQEGECLMSLLRANPLISRLILCDTWGPIHGGTNRGSHDHIEAKLNKIGYLGRVTYLDGDSGVLIPQITEQVDLAYVDGDHSEQAAYRDITNVWPLVRQTMVVHDIYMPSVRTALNRFCGENVVRVEEYSGGTGTAAVHRDD